MPSIQVTGQLVDPTTGVEGSADIRIASLINYGQTTKKSISHKSTDVSGNYDFQLVYGKHLIFVKYEDERIYIPIGYAVVGDSTPDPIDLIQLINLSDENPPSELVTELQQLREDTLNDIVDTSAQVLENAGYQGEWASGTSTALKGETWQVNGRYYVALKDTSVDPINDNDNWREVVNTESVTTAQNDIVGGSIFKGSNGEYVQNGDEIPSGIGFVRLVGGLYQLDLPTSQSETVASIDEAGRTITTNVRTYVILNAEYANNQGVFADQFGAIGKTDGTAIDVSDQIILAITFCTNNKRALIFRDAKYGYTKDITFTCETYGMGVDTTHLVKLSAPATIYHTKGSFRGIKIAPLQEGVPVLNDTSIGFIANDVWRKRIEVRVEDHGGDGVQFQRGNLSRIKAYTRRNGGRGFVFPEEPISGDNNCVEVWIESSSNVSTGFEIEESATPSYMANCMKGYVISQNNGTTGDPDKDYNVILAGYDHDNLMIYSEFVGDSVWLKDKLFSSKIFLSVASYLSLRDDTLDTSNNELSYVFGARGDRRTKQVRLERLRVKKEDFTGQLQLEQVSPLNYELTGIDSSSDQTLTIGETLKIVDAEGGRLAFQLFKQATLNFGTIAAGDTVFRSITFDTAVLPFSVATAMPRYMLPAGITYDVFVLDASPDTAHIRCTNVTSAPIAVPQGAWRVQAMSD